MIKRIISDKLSAYLFKGKAIVVLGPRQTGKTTLVQSILKDRGHLFLNGDDAFVRSSLESPDSFNLRKIIGQNKIVFIDEVQRLEEPGLTMKIITDEFKEVQLIASGSSALEMGNQLNEALTGRKWEFKLYPISWQEFESYTGFLEAEKSLEHRLVYGMYPDVINHLGNEEEVLKQLASSYLYKDILALSGIRKPELLEKLLQALALQLGNEVSYSELAQLLQIDKHTVSSYIDLLEKSYIIFRLKSFNRNLRNEIKNNRKIYFWDNGIRNAIIANLNDLNLRNDKGALWENFLIAERMKYMEYNGKIVNCYFWRNTEQQEIDYIEDKGGQISAFEIKWKKEGNIKLPSIFEKTYATKIQVVSKNNFRDFIMPASL